MVGVSGVSSACAAGASSYGTAAGARHRDGLDVGGVVAVGAADVGVLADRGLGEELLDFEPPIAPEVALTMTYSKPSRSKIRM